MCRPVHFAVEYAINAWMTPGVAWTPPWPSGSGRACATPTARSGHEVHELEPVPGLPDMVFAANGAFVVDGIAVGARFRTPSGPARPRRTPPGCRATASARCTPTADVHEGEGDLTVVGDLVLAGTGFRTQRGAHAEIQERTGRPVVGLDLVDPRFYHLDTALFPLDDTTVAWFPGAFSPGSRAVLRRLFPDGGRGRRGRRPGARPELGQRRPPRGHAGRRHRALADRLAARGFVPVPVELGELLKGGGGPKCCTSELRG